MAAPNNIVEDFRLCHGLLFDQSDVRLAHKCAVQANWTVKESPKTRPSLQLVNTQKVQDNYIYANNLVLDKESSLFSKPIPFSRFNENNPLYDETPDKAVIFRIDKELWNINLAQKDIKPTDEFVEAIKKAIEHDTPHKALDDVFSEYGYWMNCNIKVGSRLQRFTQVHASELGNEDNSKNVTKEWINDEDLDEILAKWSKGIHPFKSSYLLSADNSFIKIEKIGKWLEYSPGTSSQWSVIERADFIPTYKLLDESLIARIEVLFNDETEILMTGESLIDCQCADICQVKFSQPLLSDAYKVHGEVYSNGERCDVAVTLYFANIYGFSLEIEWHEFPERVEDIHVKWKLSGNRARIGWSDLCYQPGIRVEKDLTKRNHSPTKQITDKVDSSTTTSTLPITSFNSLTPYECDLLINPPYLLNISLDSLLKPRHARNRPPNAWIIFRINFASRLRSEYPENSHSLLDVSKMAGEHWKNLPNIVKQYFSVLSKLALQWHKEAYSGYIYKPRRARQKRKNWSFKEVNKKKLMDNSVEVELPLNEYTQCASSDELPFNETLSIGARLSGLSEKVIELMEYENNTTKKEQADVLCSTELGQPYELDALFSLAPYNEHATK